MTRFLVLCILLISCKSSELISKTYTEKVSVTEQVAYLPFFSENEEIVYHLGYVLSYNEQHEQANWVAYELTYNEIAGGEKRSDNFKPDPLVKTSTADDKDYYKSGYDRGHLAPAGDMTWNDTAMQESFYYSNMSPQVPSFNRGIWKKLEEQVRTWALKDSVLLIATGPVLENGLPQIGVQNKVSVPRFYYKVIIDYHGAEKKGIGFVMANEKSSKALSEFAVSIDSVERLTGIDFFYSIPKPIQDSLELQHCFECW